MQERRFLYMLLLLSACDMYGLDDTAQTSLNQYLRKQPKAKCRTMLERILLGHGHLVKTKRRQVKATSRRTLVHLSQMREMIALVGEDMEKGRYSAHQVFNCGGVGDDYQSSHRTLAPATHSGGQFGDSFNNWPV